MDHLTRRSALMGASAALTLAAGCGNGIGSRGPSVIDARVSQMLTFLETNYPATVDLRNRSLGMLVMPLITEAGFFTFGGAYGRGALLVNDVVVDYYSATQFSAGVQIGAQQYAHALYFMTDAALAEFRSSTGWSAGADLQYAAGQLGETMSTDTTTALAPVIAVVFGQQGLIAGATVQGTKYTRIIP